MFLIILSISNRESMSNKVYLILSRLYFFLKNGASILLARIYKMSWIEVFLYNDEFTKNMTEVNVIA